MSNAVRFGVVGLDHWYSAIPLAEAIAAKNDAVLVGIADRDITRAQEVAANTGNPLVTDDLHALIDDPSIDVIASFVSVDQNPDIVVAAARAGRKRHGDAGGRKKADGSGQFETPCPPTCPHRRSPEIKHRRADRAMPRISPPGRGRRLSS